ncbi:hypothetical protein DFH08DRAFT_850056 [Mycena albidolilacea]|uniref:Uncharacterized protein n=1 Tax=Mycena albidolilacea TaxID=1033008 RepID=A0AAD7AET8_9AGAR|nr:hypothetical protein DFH08DRAFT_850056 [Mycena albidolilacea]
MWLQLCSGVLATSARRTAIWLVTAQTLMTSQFRTCGLTGVLTVSEPLPYISTCPTHNSTTHLTACSTKSSSQSSLWLWYRASLASLRPSRTFLVRRYCDICVRTGFVTSSFAELVGLLLDTYRPRHSTIFTRQDALGGGGGGGGGGFSTRLWRDATQLWEETVTTREWNNI